MKRLLVRLAAVILVAAMVLGVAPQASAQDGTPAFKVGNLAWVAECDPVVGFGVFEFEVVYVMAPGYRIVESYLVWSASLGTLAEGSYEQVWTTSFDFSWTGTFPVPSDGYRVNQIDVYAPNGVHVTTNTVAADCTTGELWGPYADLYGINEPPSSARVMGTVLADTPVYSEPSPTAALKPVLKAGQTWFIVGQTTGTDGALWYKVFVGGANMGYVPASVMAPQGAVPGAK